MTQVIVIRGKLAQQVQAEAQRLGISAEELLAELLYQGLDPDEKASRYIEVALDLLDRAREELKRGDIRQAAEKLWGVAALAIKAYALWKEGKRLSCHRELWEYSRELIEELEKWVHDAWMSANGMHICFYKGWCTDRHVREAHERIEKLVKGLSSRIEEKKQS